MKRTLLFTIIVTVCATTLIAQKNTAYAITASQKGQSSWAEVKLIDLATGQEMKSIYKSDDPVEILNARTGNPVVKKVNNSGTFKVESDKGIPEKTDIFYRKYERDRSGNMTLIQDMNKPQLLEKRVLLDKSYLQNDKPFATNSAACAYDKKNNRLYYTPIGINQLRYIDLKSETPKIYYFEDETFGALSGRHDVPNQITRMVIGDDGNGYALTNNGNHLIRFTTKKKQEITDLGPLTDHESNAKVSIHSAGGYGGDMIGDDKGNLYLITANRNVFKIDLKSMVATYKGSITGLPRGYSTNGAMVEKGTTVVVSSANSTEGYFKFDINTLAAEKMENNGTVFNASDLAGSVLISARKVNDDKVTEVSKEPITLAEMNRASIINEDNNNIAVYPNPAEAGSIINVTFADLAKGKYTIQFMDISGKTLGSKSVTVSGKTQMEAYQLPDLTGKGNYIIKVMGENGKVVSINKILIQ